MNITFTLELSSNKDPKREVSILVRMTQNRKHKRIATGIQIPKSDWDAASKKVRKKHPQATELNRLLDEKLKKVLQTYRQLLETCDDVTLDELVASLSREMVTNFFEFANATKLAEIKSRNKLGTYRRYEAVLTKLKAFAGPNLSIRKVNYPFLQEYVVHLRKELKNSQDTVSSNLSVIRAIINEAIRHGIYKDRNPFDLLKLRYTDNTKEKLTVDELKRVFTTQLPPIPSLQMARDFFLACFLAEGTRAGDMMVMQRENIVNNCLVFEQMKTGRRMVIPIVPELDAIFERYRNDGRFLFPYLNGVSKVDEVVINSRITLVNKYLKELAKYCGIFKKLSTHCARHTFTDLALNATNENIYQVQQSLGHKSVKMTERYSQNRVNFQKPALLNGIMDKWVRNKGE